MKMQNSRLTSLFQRLETRQIGEKYVRRVALPAWWNDEIAQSEMGFAQMASYIAAKLGLDVSSLLSEGPIGFAPRQTAWKKPVNASIESLEVEGAIASQTAQIAIEATPEGAEKMPATAAQWRERLLSRGEKVTFEALLDACWEVGIAVLTLTGDALPTPKKGRPHGLAARFDGRDAVVLMGGAEHKHTAWQLFRLAHEVGHIARGHLGGEGVIFDEKIWENQSDPQEIEADQFAVELLFGREKMNIRTKVGQPWMSAEVLATHMGSLSQKFCVEPGAIALNWARTMASPGCGQNCWATANGAIATLPAVNAHDLIRARLEANLDWDELDAEQAAFVRRVNQLEAPAPFSRVPAKAWTKVAVAA